MGTDPFSLAARYDQDGGVLEALHAELLLVLGPPRVEVVAVDATEAKDCHAACLRDDLAELREAVITGEASFI